MFLENRRHGAKLRRTYVNHDHSNKLALVPDNQCNCQNLRFSRESDNVHAKGQVVVMLITTLQFWILGVLLYQRL